MKIIFSCYVPYSITADAIWTIPGVQLAFMAPTVTLQGTQFANKNFHEKVAMDIVFQRKKNRTQIL
jgi:hypothetical protein